MIGIFDILLPKVMGFEMGASLLSSGGGGMLGGILGSSAATGAGASTLGSAAGGGGMLASLMPYAQLAQSAYNLASPQGPLVKGDLVGTLNSANAFQSGLSSAGDPFASFKPSTAIGDADILGRGSVDSFKLLAPDIQREIIRILRQGK